MKKMMFNVAGQRFGRLLAIRYVLGKWICKCDCGKEAKVAVTFLRNGNTRSCGCLHKETLKANSLANTKHGGCNSSEYSSWEHAKARCYNKKHRGYKNYGAKGITMCAEWSDSFIRFLEYMGKKPTPKHTLERIRNELGYEPGNVRWATMAEQGVNRSNNVKIEWQGKIQTIAEWARELEMPHASLYNRLIRRNWPMERAMVKRVPKL